MKPIFEIKPIGERINQEYSGGIDLFNVGTMKIKQKFPEGDPIVIDDFAVPYKTQRYFHSVIQGLADFLILKKNYPEAKLIIFESGGIWNQSIDSYSTNPNIDKDLLDIFKDNAIYIPKNKEVVLNRCAISGNYHSIFSGLWMGAMSFESDLYRVQLLKEDLLPLLPIKRTEKKKYFISRSQTKGNRSTTEEKLYNKTDMLFEKLGFTVINFEEMGLVEQIEAMVNASVVVGFQGSNMLNTIFCDQNTNVFLIKLKNSGYFWWDMIIAQGGARTFNVLVNAENGFVDFIKQLYEHSEIYVMYVPKSAIDIAQELENS